MKKQAEYLLFSFFLGICIMLIELISSRWIAIFYGNYLYTWTTLLFVTMLGLSIGFSLFSFLKKNYNSIFLYWFLLFLSSILLGIFPWSGYSILNYFYAKDGFTIFSACLLFLTPIMILFGAFTPLLIQLITENIESSGKSSAWIFGITNFGSLLISLLIGFILFEFFNTYELVLYVSFGFLLFLTISILNHKNYKYLFIVFITIIVNLFVHSKNKDLFFPKDKNFLAQSESMLGQVIVEDKIVKSKKYRYLYIDRLPQSIINPYTFTSINSYVHTVSLLSTEYKDSSNALILGMGGASIAFEFERLGFKTDIVEFDPNVIKICHDFFGLKQLKSRIYTDDARHYIRKCTKKYDIIMIDIISGEFAPTHIYTQESFNEMLRILEPGGTLFVYFFGPVIGENSIAFQSLLKTIRSLPVQYQILNEKKFLDGAKLFRLTHQKDKLPKMDLYHFNPCCRKFINNFSMLNDSLLKIEGKILTDDLPILDVYYPKMFPKYKARLFFWGAKDNNQL